MCHALGPSGLSMRHGSASSLEADDTVVDAVRTLSSSGVESPVTSPGDHCCSLNVSVPSSAGCLVSPLVAAGEAGDVVSDEVVSNSNPNSLSALDSAVAGLISRGVRSSTGVLRGLVRAGEGVRD